MSGESETQPQPTAEQQHKLETSWVLWYDSSTSAPVSRSNAVTGWITNLKKIARFTTIEEFWGVMNSVPPASSVSQGSNYFLFKEAPPPTPNPNALPSLPCLRLHTRASDLCGKTLQTSLAGVGSTTFPALLQLVHWTNLVRSRRHSAARRPPTPAPLALDCSSVFAQHSDSSSPLSPLPLALQRTCPLSIACAYPFPHVEPSLPT
jgi:hypothetical protein